jgi:hypothetical protein
VTRRSHPGRDAVLAAVQDVLDSAEVTVVVTQDGQPSTLERLVRLLDNVGLIDLTDIQPLADANLLAEAQARVARDTGVRHDLDDVIRDFGIDPGETGEQP